MKEALKLALEALEAGDWYINQLEMIVYCIDDDGTHENRAKVQAAITAIKEALAQDEQELEYCMDYHCAGDCGQPHNQKEMQTFLVAQPEQEPLEELRQMMQIEVDRLIAAKAPKRQPLTLNEISAMEEKVYMRTTHKGKPLFEYAQALIRAVEAAHGIKENT